METAVDTNFVCVSFNDFRNGSAITVDIDSYAVVEAIGFANRVGVAYTKMGFSPASFTSWLSKEALLDSLAVDGEELSEIKIGEAEVRELFKVPTGVVAGCYIREGKVTRSAKLHVLRRDEDVFTGEIGSLRRFENDVREVQAGRECGIRIKDSDDVEIGDQLIVFNLEEVKR